MKTRRLLISAITTLLMAAVPDHRAGTGACPHLMADGNTFGASCHFYHAMQFCMKKKCRLLRIHLSLSACFI